jgi:hypothetical protein
MIRYIFLPSGREIYVHAAYSLKNKGIAEPVLWHGDPRINSLATKYFPGSVIEHSLFRELHSFPVSQHYYSDGDFFVSENYARLKDRCLKMMDRVDNLGCFSRIDRESLIYKVCLLWIQKINLLKPEAIVMCDPPHTHEIYSLYEIALFFGIPVGMIKQWGIAPCAYMFVDYGDSKTSVIAKDEKYSSDQKVLTYINEYFYRLLNYSNTIKYEPTYMKSQRLETGFFSRKIHFIVRQYKRYLSGALTIKRIVHYPFKLIKNNLLKVFKVIKYSNIVLFDSSSIKLNPTNPYKYGVIKTWYIIRRRELNLRNSYESLSTHLQDNVEPVKYVYFPLHYEPEASTNPEGGIFQDQFIAILNLRTWIPNNVCIYVKEHPSQFYSHSVTGYASRSPYFYQALSIIKGVKIIPLDTESLSLIKDAIFVGTITGTVAVEAAILEKKTIVFGEAWYKGMPNTFQWSKNLEYDEFLKKITYKSEYVRSFLHDLYDNSAVPMMLNPSGPDMYPEFECNDYQEEELKCAEHLLNNFFKLL